MGAAERSLNFRFLEKKHPQLARLGAIAEKSFLLDANLCLMKVRQLGEMLTKELAVHTGVYEYEGMDQAARVRLLESQSIINQDLARHLHSLRRIGNEAVHALVGSEREAINQLRIAWRFAIFFHKTVDRPSGFKPGAFVPPAAPRDTSAELLAELEAAREEAAKAKESAEQAKELADYNAELASDYEKKLQEAEAARVETEKLFDENEAAHQAELQEALAKADADRRSYAQTEIKAFKKAAAKAQAEHDPSEAETRVLIDQQLRDAGWEVDSQALTYAKGVRPQKGRNLAIAEWPTENGPADYVLFIGLEAVGIVEAKRKARDVSASIEQAKRYSRGFRAEEGIELLPGAKKKEYGDYKVPFLFATNGKPYHKQIETKSGVWFLDGRRERNISKALAGWYSPDGLKGLLSQDIDAAHDKLGKEPTDYLGLRDYQVSAIKAVETAIEAGQREMLLAMATGTGKTRTCIGLVYRLLKAGRFRRILFVVDRSALGEQAANAFKETKIENLQTFAEIFELKEMDEPVPESETRLQVATIQGMVKRILFNDDGPLPTVDQYDCIVIDECHRGYLLDREMSDAELSFRDETDYISKYRRVLEHFDAVKVGLTATPAFHTTEIFGKPVYEYTYREAVVDGFLVDFEPPIKIITALAEDGITWKVGEEVATYSSGTGEVQLSLLPDEVHLEVEQFNRKVVTENFNKTVCDFLAERIDPEGDQKTVVFCATDEHADLVVRLLKKSFEEKYGEVPDSAVVKITGKADKPRQLIRRYKNEHLPTVAVTVDLLTTGIDVPAICNVVFLRQVRSRILYEQMLGRATRLCPDIGKEAFRIYDAVDLYSKLQKVTQIKPVVVNPTITYEQLAKELTELRDEKAIGEVRDQFIAKLRRKKRLLDGDALDRFEAAAGTTPDALIETLKDAAPSEVSAWFRGHVTVGALLDQKVREAEQVFISEHDDEIRRIEEGSRPPEDYLTEFKKYVDAHLNEIPALIAVTQRPKELTRQALKELKLALDEDGFTEARLRAAWRKKSNRDIAASIIGYIRQAALGDPLLPYDDRVRAAIARIEASQDWTPVQRKWLKRLGEQLIAETVVDKDALERGQFKQQGGFKRLNKIFDGRLEAILGELTTAVWEDAG